MGREKANNQSVPSFAMRAIAAHCLRTKDIEAATGFYCAMLGMRQTEQWQDSSGIEHRALAFTAPPGVPATRLILRLDSSFERSRASSLDTYWKIGISLADVDRARERLIACGIEVSAPAQFKDIGYLCHLRDPDGYTIELLQHEFEANKSVSPAPTNEPLGSAPCLGQISLRVSNIESSLAFYRDRLGLRLLSRQDVDEFRFSLYFLACTDEAPPHNDIFAVENREWLWQRPYTLLELQSRWDATRYCAEAGSGFESVTFDCVDESSRGAAIGTARDSSLRDPDGNSIHVRYRP